MSRFHTLSRAEILGIPAGRILNTLVAEYVLREHPTRWSNSAQEAEVCFWFEQHPRACAEDDGGYCSIDGMPDFSGDPIKALKLKDAGTLSGLPLSIKTVGQIYWATFGNVSFEGDQSYSEYKRRWVAADTLPLAICRAALISAR